MPDVNLSAFNMHRIRGVIKGTGSSKPLKYAVFRQQ
jgi:hypothetical protein